VWTRDDTVIWLDYPTQLGVARLMARAMDNVRANLRAWLAGERTPAFSHDSSLLYAFRARQERKADFGALLAAQEFGHVKVLRFRSPSEMEAWFSAVLAEAHADGRVIRSERA
jgi:hypothetical protein